MQQPSPDRQDPSTAYHSLAEIEPRFGFLDYRLAHGEALADEAIPDEVSTRHLADTLREFTEETP